ncbi:MAG: transcriptional regulator [Planctomycetes bacterium]|nr:transcriptional regulator [Planctomycetota bacterium]MCW8134081.1 transcriptional regulator [Planctomycetota bacterium]
MADIPAKAREKILFFLKTKGPQTAAQVARRLGVTPMAVRQHLYALREEGDVQYMDERRKVGRPARVWSLSAATAGHFPDSHSELAVGILQAARQAFGEAGMSKLIERRMLDQIERYESRVGKRRGLEAKVAELAGLRDEEGYMAEWSRESDGSLLLIENHCPICAAAQTCQELCTSELRLFRTVLGAEVEREEHILSGRRRCLYRIRQAG